MKRRIERYKVQEPTTQQITKANGVREKKVDQLATKCIYCAAYQREVCIYNLEKFIPFKITRSADLPDKEKTELTQEQWFELYYHKVGEELKKPLREDQKGWGWDK